MNALMLLAALTVLLLLQYIILNHYALKRLAYSRHFSKKEAFEGDEVRLIEIIQNKKPLPVPFIKAESRISSHLKFINAVDTKISVEQYHRSVFFLRAYSQITREHTVRLERRGYYQSGAVSLTTMDLSGAASPSITLETNAEIAVFPRLLSLLDIPADASRWQGDVVVKRLITLDPMRVSGIRAYTPGDPPAYIHWSATARTGGLKVKTHDATADIKMLVVINAQMTPGQWADLMPYEQDTVEFMISLCATLITDALRSGIEAGFAVNLPMDKSKEWTLFPPTISPGRDTELLNAMAHLTIKNTRSFTDVLDNLCVYTGMDILILSVYEDEKIQERIHALRQKGNTAKMHLVQRPTGTKEGGD